MSLVFLNAVLQDLHKKFEVDEEFTTANDQVDL